MTRPDKHAARFGKCRLFRPLTWKAVARIYGVPLRLVDPHRPRRRRHRV